MENIKTKEEARQYAIDWQNFEMYDRDISYGELAEMQEEFRKLGEKFDLLEEFSTNGII